jgi:MoaA/NifB/PqqE/SkfB family radical SAM enzyme
MRFQKCHHIGMIVSIGQMMQCKFIKKGIRINEDGTVVPCCTFTGNFGITYTNDFNFENYLNSPQIESLQKQFDKNQWPDSCKNCYEKESLNQISIRNQGDIAIDEGLYLDVVVGKECNSDCVMCYSGQSSKIASRLKRTIPTFSVPAEDQYWINQVNYSNFIEDENFWNNLETVFPKIETIKFLGGEPLLNKKLWEWLESSQVLNYKAGKKLIMVTNASIVDVEKLHVFSNWKRTDIVLSIDAIEEEYEWIRHGLHWKTIANNVKLLQSLKDAYISVHATINMFNVASIYQLIKWVDENNLLFSFTPVTSPTLLSVEYTPIHILEQSLTDLVTLNPKNIILKIHVNGIKNLIKSAIKNNKADARLRQSITNYFNNHRTHKMNWETLKCTT